MPAVKKSELFECPSCGNKQPVSLKGRESVRCVGCNAKFAIVDHKGKPAYVQFYSSVKQDEEPEPSAALKVELK